MPSVMPVAIAASGASREHLGWWPFCYDAVGVHAGWSKGCTRVKDLMRTEPAAASTIAAAAPDRTAILRALEQKVLWLAVWMVHHANHLRPKADGLKVGGHQASSASIVTLMTALYFEVLRPNDRVAVKPHASPVFHAIQYLLGRQSRENLERFRALGGAQSYPSRTKDADDVDFSTGSVGLGVAMTSFAALVRDYLQAKGGSARPTPPGRMIALLGDAEFDEGNVFEAMLETWKHEVRRVWWIIDYNRQSLDASSATGSSIGWTRCSGHGLERVHAEVRRAAQAGVCRSRRRRASRVDRQCPNFAVFGALAIQAAPPGARDCCTISATRRDSRVARRARRSRRCTQLMTNLAGHDLESILRGVSDARSDVADLHHRLHHQGQRSAVCRP